CEGEPLERDHLGARLGESLRHALRAVVDPGLIEQDPALVGEEALAEHALDDLLARLLRLRLDLVRVHVDVPLLRHDVLGHVLAADPGRRRPRDVHGELPREQGVSALQLDEDADLVRGRVDVVGEQLAVARLEPRRPQRDVLAQLGDLLDALLLERGEPVGALGLDRLEHLLRELDELVVLGHRLGLAADGRERADVAADRHEHDALGGLATGALAGLRHALLAQEPLRSLDVAASLDERVLRVHHPRSRLVAELLDLGCADRRAHSAGTSFSSWAGSAAASGSAASSGAGGTSAASAPARAAVSSAGGGTSATSAAVGASAT